ncbi:Uncharacterized protein APZ42_023780 [Daphnia magna]|uniref:Uncharacterized protein n=1 Tax=Daphnia magna TaxID=35525 RepID=A0A164U4B7_9CRUS|nr:Uncharacterized protein APZ42_023780 [Daphnia magna]
MQSAFSFVIYPHLYLSHLFFISNNNICFNESFPLLNDEVVCMAYLISMKQFFFKEARLLVSQRLRSTPNRSC